MDIPALNGYNRRMYEEFGIKASTLLLYGMIFGEAVVFAWLLTPVSIWLAPRLGYLDHPGHRKVHAAPKPVLGGLAIFGGFQLMILGNLWLGNAIGPLLPDTLPGVFGRLLVEARTYHDGISVVRTPLIGFMLGGWLVFIVGLIDDRLGMSPLVKLIGQCAAGAILYFSGTRIDFLYEVSPVIAFLATVLWVAMVANAFNWIDNMDGLCAGIAAVNCFFFAMVSHQVEAQVFLVLCFLSLCGACIGFLHWNKYPSKLFMGDSGSMFIGYTVAALSVLASYATTDPAGKSLTNEGLAFFVPLVILSIPLFDMFTVIAIRLKHRKPVYLGDKNHISHRLVDLGLTHRQAVLMIYLFCFCTGMGGLLLHRLNFRLRFVVLLQVGIIFTIILLLERVSRNRGEKRA